MSDPTAPDRVARAVAAARAVAGAAGVRCDAARVLHDGFSTVVHLAPAPVVARVAALTPALRSDVARPLAREVELAGALARAGAPVVPPSDLLPPGPHRHEHLVLSFWTWVDVRPEAPDARRTAASLADLHGWLADQPPAGAPLDTPLDDLAAFLDRAPEWGLDGADRDGLRARLERLRPRLDGELRRLHGDAHPGNLLATPSGWLWGDLEDTCSGPLAWDLACLRSTTRLDGRAALDAFPGAPTDAELAPWLELRRLHVAAWWQVYAAARPQHAATARERLTEALRR